MELDKNLRPMHSDSCVSSFVMLVQRTSKVGTCTHVGSKYFTFRFSGGICYLTNTLYMDYVVHLMPGKPSCLLYPRNSEAGTRVLDFGCY
jgi:hypothetical protein